MFGQPHFVSLATSILTGLHGMCILAATLWFVYQLKHDSVWAGWIRTGVKWFLSIADWIILRSMEWNIKGMKWMKWIIKGMKSTRAYVTRRWFRRGNLSKEIRIAARGIATGIIFCIAIGIIWIMSIPIWIWKMVKLSYNNYKQNLHLQRNIFWYFHSFYHWKRGWLCVWRAFGVDNRVARLNCVIMILSDDLILGDRAQREPCLLSKLIRYFAYPIKKCWLSAKSGLSSFGCSIRKRICAAPHTRSTESDIELGGMDGADGRKDFEAPEGSFPESPVEKAKKEFRMSLQKMFSDADMVKEIMKDVKLWENRRWGAQISNQTAFR